MAVGVQSERGGVSTMEYSNYEQNKHDGVSIFAQVRGGGGGDQTEELSKLADSFHRDHGMG